MNYFGIMKRKRREVIIIDFVSLIWSLLNMIILVAGVVYIVWVLRRVSRGMESLEEIETTLKEINDRLNDIDV
ncbi:MAG: hypothetical protein ACOCQB_02525 [Halanaerobiaceae bacterium]